jgi:GT2 family glycosyltransferase
LTTRLDFRQPGTVPAQTSRRTPPLVAVPASRPRPVARGKFIWVGDRKLYVRGVTYGTFGRGQDGFQFPASEVVADDFTRMAANGLNAIRTYTAPPRWLLDLALEHDLWVMAGLAWEQHVDFLAGRRRARSIEDRLRAAVAECAGHRAVLCYAVGNEIPSRVVRWAGRAPVERFLERLHVAGRREDPEGLFTYVNYPSTEYLESPASDLVTFNVYLERRSDLAAYLARVQNLAGERPLVMAELGLDSRAHGHEAQAETLAWQVRTAFEAGCAGAFVFSWTDEWHVAYLSPNGSGNGTVEILDWDFGLTDRERREKPALPSVRQAFREIPFDDGRAWPKVSVVVCTYNGARTLDRCLAGLEQLDYPDYEVIVVNDGSTDASADIAARRRCRLVSTENRGLASARNTGLEAACGEIVAYIDDDARPDPHWLRYLVATMEDGGFAGAGGPNIPPQDDSPVARCVAEAPGGPVHVLTSDREAEHVPGCNMAFRRSALEDVGGFDPQFRVAGDDVDICWRLLDSGRRLGFSPAAVVWHSRRPSVRAYLRQQRGYGAAEALLERKWPDRYGPAGRARWRGRLYGPGLVSGIGRSRIYYGTWGSEPFQSLYGAPRGRLAALGSHPEWHLLIAALAAASLAALWWAPLVAAVPLLCAALVATAGPGARAAARAPFMRERGGRARRARMWLLTTVLHLAQPLARLRGRMRTPSWRPSRPPRPVPPWPRTRLQWSDEWESAEDRIAAIRRGACADRAPVFCGGIWDRWDLHLRGGLLGGARLRVGLEEHGGGRQLMRTRITPHVPAAALAVVSVLAVVAALAAGVHVWTAAALLGVAATALGARLAWECGVGIAWLERHLDPRR